MNYYEFTIKESESERNTITNTLILLLGECETKCERQLLQTPDFIV